MFDSMNLFDRNELFNNFHLLICRLYGSIQSRWIQKCTQPEDFFHSCFCSSMSHFFDDFLFVTEFGASETERAKQNTRLSARAQASPSERVEACKQHARASSNKKISGPSSFWYQVIKMNGSNKFVDLILRPINAYVRVIEI